jgi:hypothetical protein
MVGTRSTVATSVPGCGRSQLAIDGRADRLGCLSKPDLDGFEHRLLPGGDSTGLQAFPKTFLVAFLSTFLPAHFSGLGLLRTAPTVTATDHG